MTRTLAFLLAVGVAVALGNLTGHTASRAVTELFDEVNGKLEEAGF